MKSGAPVGIRRREHLAPICVGGSALVIAALVATGCAAHASNVNTGSWRELRTDRILLVTDLDADDARERALEFERLGSALSELYGLVVTLRPAQPTPIRVIHLASCKELRRRYGEEVGGFVTQSIDFSRDRLIVTCDHDAGIRNELVVHELTHDLNHRYLADLPPWLEEGLATYYQTLQLRDGHAVVGLRPRMDARYWRGVAILPSMQELVGMSQEQLVGLQARRGYFAAWKLTHLLANGSEDYNRRFRKMVAAFGEGKGKTDAFSAAFGELAGRLPGEYGTYHLRRELNTLTVGYRAAKVGIRSERSLRPGEVHALFIELRPARGDVAEIRAGIQELLDRVERDDPSWHRRLYWRALVQYRFGNRSEPVADLLRRYLALEPNDANAWRGLVDLEMDRYVPPGHLGVEPQPPPGLEQMEKEVHALIRVASTPSQLNLIGWYYALRRRPETGLNFAVRALQAEPGYSDCWDTLALLYYHSGRAADAVEAQKRAIGLMAERGGGASEVVRARLRAYEQAAARAAGK